MQKITLSLKEKFISEDVELVGEIKKVLLKDDCKCMVFQSPQGTGKNTFLDSLDISYSLLSPTRMLTEQQYEQYGGEMLIGFEDDYIGSCIEIKSTYASAIKAFASTNDLLVIDEVHKILDYVGFAYDTAFATIQTAIKFLKNKNKVILMSATPEPITEVFEKINDKFPKIDYWIEVKPTKKPTYLNKLIVVPSDISFEKYILDSEVKNNGKKVGLIDTKKKLKYITDKLIDNKINAIGISSENRDSQEIKPRYEEIVNTQKLSHDILNATSFIDCGINLNDEDIMHMYCMGYNIASIKQFFCRARKSKPTGYVQIRRLNRIQQKQLEIGKEELFNELLETAHYCFKQYKKGIITEQALNEIIGIAESKQYGYGVSELKVRQYIRYLHDCYKLSTFEGVKQVLADYYESIELYSPQEEHDKILAAADEYLLQFVGKRLGKEEKDEIVSELNNLGFHGTYFKSMIEKLGLGYIVNHPKNRLWYSIEK